jgi:hypothetical protein
MRFPYLPLHTRRLVHPLTPTTARFLPIFSVSLLYGGRVQTMDGLLDSASSDTIFPLPWAQKLGIDLSRAPVGQSVQAGGVALFYRYAPVRLHVSDGRETCQWDALVAFLSVPGKIRATLGHAGFLEFFDSFLFSSRLEVELHPNAAFSGSHSVH